MIFLLMQLCKTNAIHINILLLDTSWIVENSKVC